MTLHSTFRPYNEAGTVSGGIPSAVSIASPSEMSGTNLLWNLPKKFKNGFSEKYSFSSSSDKRTLIIKIAESITEICAHFLTKEQDHRSTDDCKFRASPKKFPKEKDVNLFKINFKNRLVSLMKKESASVVVLQTFELPEGHLKEELEKSKISRYGGYRYFFPCNSSITIMIGSVVSITMRSHTG